MKATPKQVRKIVTAALGPIRISDKTKYGRRLGWTLWHLKDEGEIDQLRKQLTPFSNLKVWTSQLYAGRYFKVAVVLNENSGTKPKGELVVRRETI